MGLWPARKHEARTAFGMGLKRSPPAFPVEIERLTGKIKFESKDRSAARMSCQQDREKYAREEEMR